jgi:hypothetical protein
LGAFLKDPTMSKHHMVNDQVMGIIWRAWVGA